MEPERPETQAGPDEAALQRRVFMVRMAAWGTVLLLAVIASNLRAGSSDGADQGANGSQLNGRTSQGLPIWAVVDGTRVHEIRMTWHFDCGDDGELEPFGGTFRESTDEFEFDGRRFEVEVDDDFPEGADGWTAHLKAEIAGSTSGEGRASGTSSAVMWFTRGSERGSTCHSERVRWSLP